MNNNNNQNFKAGLRRFFMAISIIWIVAVVILITSLLIINYRDTLNFPKGQFHAMQQSNDFIPEGQFDAYQKKQSKGLTPNPDNAAIQSLSHGSDITNYGNDIIQTILFILMLTMPIWLGWLIYGIMFWLKKIEGARK